MTKYKENPSTVSIPRESTQMEIDLHMQNIAKKGVANTLLELSGMVQSAQEEIYFAQRKLQFIKSTIDALHHHIEKDVIS